MRLGALALVALTLGCGRTRLSARSSVTPMMLGHVRYIGPYVGRLAQSDAPSTFVMASSPSHGGFANARWHAIDSAVPQALALAIADLPASERNGVLAVSPITCELRQWFALIVSVLRSECVVQTAALTTYPEPVGPKPLP